jgi:hypothetical protein
LVISPKFCNNHTTPQRNIAGNEKKRDSHGAAEDSKIGK